MLAGQEQMQASTSQLLTQAISGMMATGSILLGITGEMEHATMQGHTGMGTGTGTGKDITTGKVTGTGKSGTKIELDGEETNGVTTTQEKMAGAGMINEMSFVVAISMIKEQTGVARRTA